MNALIYLRVSTKEQAEKGESGEGYSIPAQREACAKFIADKGWNFADEFIDAGESAKSADRPNLKAMLTRVAEGDIGALIVHKIDRLARNIEDHIAIRAALRKYGVQLCSVTENIEETASGKLVEGIHALMAEFYSANLASEVRKGMSQKAKQGQWPAKAPIGYLNELKRVNGKDTKRIVLDPDRAILVKEAFNLYATGDYSLAELQATLAARGLTSPAARRPGAAPPISALARMLQNPFYTGIIEWDGIEYPGQHKQLITRNLFEQVQEVLHAHNKAGVRQRRHDHYLKGILYCEECGRRLSLTLAKGKYLYFYCLGQKNALKHKTGCQQPYVMACDAERAVEDLYKRIQLPPGAIDRLTKQLEAEIVDRQSSAAEMRVILTNRLAKLAEERDKLLKAYYSNAIPLDLLKKDQDRITESENKARTELEAAETDLVGWEEVLKLAIRLAGNCHAAYLKARPKVRRRFNEAVVKAVYVRDGKVARKEFTEVFEVLFSRGGLNKAAMVPPTGFEPVLPP
ncbi:MAG: recombinase family protein [Actinomycetota bacterium]|nr:recombinase family protein [Actinomycetota bacterium]